MGNILRNPKTTFLGFAAIVSVLAKWVQAGHVDFSDFQSLWDIAVGLGLVMAKDANVTGVK